MENLLLVASAMMKGSMKRYLSSGIHSSEHEVALPQGPSGSSWTTKQSYKVALQDGVWYLKSDLMQNRDFILYKGGVE